MKIYCAVILVALSHFSYSQASAIDIIAASPVYSIDLDRTPQTRQKAYASNFSGGLQFVNEKLNDATFEREMTKYLKTLNTKLMNNAGVIVKIRMYSDEFGTTVLPQNFLLPLAVGTSPIDAYSEFINTPTLMVPNIEAKSVDGSYFIWIFKSEDQLAVACIPREFNKDLTKASVEMAIKKTTDKSFSYQPMTSLIPNYVAKAAYWNESLKTYKLQLEQNKTFSQVEALNKRFIQLQSEHSQLIQEYEVLVRKEQNNDTLLKTIELGLAIGSSLASVNSNVTTFDPALIKSQNAIIKREIKEVKRNIDKTSGNLDEVDGRLKNFYRLM